MSQPEYYAVVLDIEDGQRFDERDAQRIQQALGELPRDHDGNVRGLRCRGINLSPAKGCQIGIVVEGPPYSAEGLRFAARFAQDILLSKQLGLHVKEVLEVERWRYTISGNPNGMPVPAL